MSRKIGLIHTFIRLMDSKKQKDRQREIQYIQYNSIQYIHGWPYRIPEYTMPLFVYCWQWRHKTKLNDTKV